MRFGVIAAAVAALSLMAGCSDRQVVRAQLFGLGQPCEDTEQCREIMICDPATLTCEPSGTIDVDEPCIFTRDCLPNLNCDLASKTCQLAGAAGEGEPCTKTTDCQNPFFCAFVGFGGTCSHGGPLDVGLSCSNTLECAAGLLCDPLTSKCAEGLPSPIGDPCMFDRDCIPDAGIVCQAGTCGGYGPDGIPVTPWGGAACAASSAQQGSFRLLFQVPDVGSNDTDFFKLPFPNDARNARGRVDLSGFPQPPLGAVPVDLLGEYINAIEADQDGFGPNQTVFLRFSGSPKFCADGCNPMTNPCEPGCMGGFDRTVYAVDVTPGSAGQWTPVGFAWVASTGRTPYICHNWLAYSPAATTPWGPGRTYFVFIRTNVQNNMDQGIQQDADFALMLQTMMPGNARLQDAWTAYQPVRDWLAGAPSFTMRDGGQMVQTSDIAGGAVFTVRDPKTLIDAMATQVYSSMAAAVRNQLHCTSPGPNCTDTSMEPFTELRGLIDLPNYQAGMMPYESSGGEIVVDAMGVPQVQGTIPVRWSMSIPDSPAPMGGWPLAIYSHGTGGDFRTHLTDGTAAALSGAFAVIGIDNVAHGARRGTSGVKEDQLFFNYLNPRAARGNILQAAIDQIGIQHAAANLNAAVSASTGASLDPSRIVFLGHSQGSTVGSVAMSRAEGMEAVVLSGAGGGLIDTFMAKTSPYDLPTIMRFVLADPTLTNARTQPALSLIQGYMEDADPVNYARHLVADLVGPSTPKNVLHIIGKDDSFTPNRTSMTLTRRMGMWYIDDDNSGLLSPLEMPMPPPIEDNISNLTRVTTVHVPAAGDDGHFVLFDVPKAEERAVQFFTTWAATGTATVPP